MSGMMVSILENKNGNCSANGESERYYGALVFEDYEEGLKALGKPHNERYAILWLDKRSKVWNDYPGWCLVPIAAIAAGAWVMFGGSYGVSGNGIYDAKLPNGHPLPIHDRIEYGPDAAKALAFRSDLSIDHAGILEDWPGFGRWDRPEYGALRKPNALPRL